MSDLITSELSSQSGDERVFRVIAGKIARQHGDDMRPMLLNSRKEVIEATGVKAGDPLSVDKPFLVATNFSVSPEQWRDEHKDAKEFVVTIKYK